MLSELGGGMTVVSLHDDGSPVTEEVVIMSGYPLEELKGIAKYLAGIKPGISVFDRQYMIPGKTLEKLMKYAK